MNASKIVVPSAVADAIRHYTDLADSKSEAFTDILAMGYEGINAEIILRHFDGNHDLLMEALICGYEVEKSPEEKVREFYEHLEECYRKSLLDSCGDASRYHLATVTVRHILRDLGITIEGVNAPWSI